MLLCCSGGSHNSSALRAEKPKTTSLFHKSFWVLFGFCSHFPPLPTLYFDSVCLLPFWGQGSDVFLSVGLLPIS